MAAMTEVIADRTNRASVYNNFAFATPANSVSESFYLGPGSVITSGGARVNFGGGFLGQFIGGTQGNPGYNQVWINPVNGNVQQAGVPNASTAFPVGSLPIALVITDGVGRIQQLVDMRPDPPL